MPTVHILNKDEVWRSSRDNPYPHAILKVWVEPPEQIDVPILPLKVGNRLLFPTCYRCCEQFPDGGRDVSYSCGHSPEERSFVTVTTSPELNAALDEGYVVRKVFRVLEYTKTDKKLFAPYVAEFVAEKVSLFSCEKYFLFSSMLAALTKR